MPAPFAFAIGGAISGAIFGAIEGGLGGALKGAGFGAVFGFTFGIIGLDPGLMAFAIIGGGVYAGVTGGGEGLANYGAGALGALSGNIAGSTATNALIGKSTVKSPQSDGSPNNSQGNNAQAQEKVGQNLNKGDIVAANGVKPSGAGEPPAKQLADNQAEIAKAGQEGKIGTGPSQKFSVAPEDIADHLATGTEVVSGVAEIKSFNTLAKVSGVLSKALTVVSEVLTPCGQGESMGRIIGGGVFGLLGTLIGLRAGPYGGIAGGVIFGIGGAYLGGMIGRRFDYPTAGLAY